MIDPVTFALGLGVIAPDLFFFLSLTLTLGTIFDCAGAVVGIALGYAFGQQLLVSAPIGPYLPWALVAPLGQNSVSDASALMLGSPVPAPGAVVVAAVGCVAFVALALRRFDRTEL